MGESFGSLLAAATRPLFPTTRALSAALLLLSAAQGAVAQPALELDSDAAGASPGQRIRVPVEAGAPVLHRATLRYPIEFDWKGFPATPGTVVGRYELDFDGDGTAELTHEVRSLGRDAAYADVFDDQRYSPDHEPGIRRDGDVSLYVSIPSSAGIGAPQGVAPYASELSLVLLPGAMASPEEGGVYTVHAELMSVDPDTGSYDDGQGTPPEVTLAELAVEVRDEPDDLDVPFDSFEVRRAQVHPRKQRRHKPVSIFVAGRFELGDASDGIDPANEPVSVSIGDFEQTLPAGELHRFRFGYVHLARHGSGIQSLILLRSGRFLLLAKRIDPDDVDRSDPVPMVLRVGDDVGEAEIPFRRSGWYRP